MKEGIKRARRGDGPNRCASARRKKNRGARYAVMGLRSQTVHEWGAFTTR